jgi:hypothetical protein
VAELGDQELGIDLELVLARLRGGNYTLVLMARQQLQALHHCVFSLHFHLVLIEALRRYIEAQGSD